MDFRKKNFWKKLRNYEYTRFKLYCRYFTWHIQFIRFGAVSFLSDSNGILTHNYLVRKRTLNHLAKLAKWLNCVLSTYLYGAFDCALLSYHVRSFCFDNYVAMININMLNLTIYRGYYHFIIKSPPSATTWGVYLVLLKPTHIYS